MTEKFELNGEQKRAVTHEVGPLLIVVGAGTGKTRVITERFVWLLNEKKLKPDEILAMTFTEKAAEEMENRVLDALPLGSGELWISTFHSFCDKILRRHGMDIGLPNDYRLLDETESWLLVRKNLDRFALDYYRPLGSPTKFIHSLIKHFSRCLDEEISPGEYLRYAENIKLNNDAAEVVKKLDLSDFTEQQRKELLKSEILRVGEIANAFHLYRQILIENNCLDFAGLISNAVKLFCERPLILEKYRQQFKYILIDEFQDTNLAQYSLVKLLSAPKNNLTVVGDDDQSIYKFRGASISNIMQFKEDFPAAQEVVLIENYRSGQEILDLAYQFIIQNDPYRLEAKLGINKKLISRSADKAEISCIHEMTGEAEAAAVVRKIVELRTTNRAEWSDFAILVRANDSAGQFVEALEQAGIPYQFYAMRGLYHKPIILDLLNYLKLLDNYHESAAVFRVLNFSHWEVDYSDIVKITHYARLKSVSLFEAVKTAAAIQGISLAGLSQVNKIISEIEKDSRIAKEKKTTEVLLNFLYQSGYLDFIKSDNERKARENLNYLQQFFQKIQRFEAAHTDAGIADFLELVKMEQEAGESGRLAFDENIGPDMVRIMTIHSAKGLEFNYVFIANLVDRKFPTDERKEPIKIPDALIREKLSAGDFHLEEERRLFYVAMTRAKRGLFFTFADDYGGGRKKRPSRFLQELGYGDKSGKGDKDGEAKMDVIQLKIVERADAICSSKQKIELPKWFSFSQMQMYEGCPLRYKFNYILKIPTPGNSMFSFGISIHETLKQFALLCQSSGQTQSDIFGNRLSTSAIPSLDQLYGIYSKAWVGDWYESAKQREAFLRRAAVC